MDEDLVKNILRRMEDIERRLRIEESKETPIYQTGTWNPTYLGSITAGVTTYTTQVGEYTRIGRLIFYEGRLEWSAATGTGNAQFGLPFTSANRTNLFASGSADITNVTFANSTPTVLIQPGVNIFLLRSPITNAATAIVQMEAAGICNFSGFYEI